MREAKTVWHFRRSKAATGGYDIMTPHNRIWTNVRCGSVAAKICGQFNFGRELQMAAETGDLGKINAVLLAYKKP